MLEEEWMAFGTEMGQLEKARFSLVKHTFPQAQRG